MASPSSVLTIGLGAWSSASLLVTLGYGIGEIRSYRVAKSQSFVAGPTAYQAIVHAAASQPIQPGSVASEAIA